MSYCNAISLSLTNEAPAVLRCWQLPVKECISPIGSPAPPATILRISLHSVCAHTQSYKKHVNRNYTPPLRFSASHHSFVIRPQTESLHLHLPLTVLPSSAPHLRSTPSCVQVQGCWQTVSLSLLYITHTHSRHFPLCELVSTQQDRSHSHCQHIKEE